MDTALLPMQTEQTEEIISLDFVVLKKHVEVEDEGQNLIY